VWLKEKNVLRGITFANPGFAASHFGDLYDSDTLNVLLNSDIYADGQLQTGIVSQHQFSSSNKLITSKGADVRDLWLTNTRWLLTDGYSISDMDAIQFQSMTSTGTQLEVQRTNAYSSVNFTNINFQTTPTGVGLYLKVTDTNGATNGLLNVTMSGTTPASSGGFTQTAGGATITGWSNVANWTGGAASTAWNTAANWDFNAVPTSATDVVIGTSIYQPQTGGAVTVHSLTVNSGATLTVTGANMTVNGDIVVQPTGKIDLNTSNVGVIAFGNVMTDTAGNTGVTTCAGPSSAALNLQAGTHTVTGKFCNLSNFGTYTVSGPLVTVGSGGTGGLQNGNGGSLNFNGHRVDAVTFANGGTGTIIMQNAVDSLFIHGGAATFSGGSETGLMTAGAIIDRGPTLTGTGTGFDASGGSQMLMVDTTFAQGLNWTTPVVGHGFNNVTLKGASGKTINGDPYITGTLLFDVSMTSGTVGGGSANIYVGDLIDNSTIVGGAFNFAGNLHIKGNPGGSFPATLNVNTLSFESGGNFVMQNNLLTHAIVVDSGSGLIPNGHWVNTQGLSLTTQNGGVLGMTTLGDSITVGAGSVYFNGGSTSGQLTMGAIVAASIFQGYINTTTLATGTSATSFAPSGTHRVWMPAGASGRIIFANPGTGATGSHFNSLRNVSSDTTSIYSDIFVDDSLYLDVSGLNFTADVTSSAANHRLITTQGLGNNPGTNPVTFNNVSLKWVDGQTAPIYFQQVTWTGFPALFTGNVFEIARISGGSSTLLGGHSFSAVVASGLAGGEYLNNTGTLPWLFNGLAGIGPVILLTGGTHSP
jgi:hypothetical protein